MDSGARSRDVDTGKYSSWTVISDTPGMRSLTLELELLISDS